MKYLQDQSMSLLKDNTISNNQHHVNAASMKNLEKQILEAAADSPSRDGNNASKMQMDSSKFQFDSRDDSFAAVDSIVDENEAGSESNMYDLIISRVLSNPKIDKRTLL